MPLHKLLLVDATPEGRALIARAFPELEKDAAILSVAKGDAVQRAKADRPDVILLDAACEARDLVAALAKRNGISRDPVISLAELRGLDPAALAAHVRTIFAEARVASQLARLEELGGTAFVREMVGLFLDTTPQRLQAARDGLATGNLEAVERAVHSLKSSAGNLGADEVQDLAGRIEPLAEARQGESIPALMRQLEDAVARIEARLSRERAAPE